MDEPKLLEEVTKIGEKLFGILNERLIAQGTRAYVGDWRKINEFCGPYPDETASPYKLLKYVTALPAGTVGDPLAFRRYVNEMSRWLETQVVTNAEVWVIVGEPRVEISENLMLGGHFLSFSSRYLECPWSACCQLSAEGAVTGPWKPASNLKGGPI